MSGFGRRGSVSRGVGDCAVRCWLGLLPLSAASMPVEQIVVVATPRAPAVADAPFAVSVVTAEALRGAGPMVNLSEALSRVPGLVVANRQNYAQDLQIHSRGFGARATFGVRGMRLVADGLPATAPDGQGQVAQFDLAGAQQVEVLRGPFSALYGASSGGVIALVSVEPTQRRVGLDLDAASAGFTQWRTTLAAPLPGGASLRASTSRMATDGPRPHSAADRELSTLRLGFRDADDRVVFTADHLDQPAQDPLGLTRSQLDADPGQTAPQAAQFDTRKTTRQSQAGVAWQRRIGGDRLQRVQVAVHAGERSVTQWQAIAAEPQASPRHPGGVIDFDRRFSGIDARATWRVGAVTLVTGAASDEQREQRRGFENFVGSAADRRFGVTGRLRRDEANVTRSDDLYAQAEWTIAEPWSASTGLRRSRVALSSTDRFLANGDDSGARRFAASLPVVALRWQPDKTWMAYVSAGRGFETPTLNEMAYRSDGSSGFNLGLEAQRSRQVEAGLKWRGRVGAVDVAVFRADTDREIGVQSNSGGRASFRNLGRTLRQGLELSSEWALAPGWRLHASATWLDAQVRDAFLACAGIPCPAPTLPIPAGRQIAGTVARAGFAELVWRARPALDLALEARAQASVPVNDANTEHAGGFGLWSARLQHTLDWGAARLETLLRVDNLTDRRVVGSVIVNEGNGRFYEPAPRRQWLLSLRWSTAF